MVPPNVLAGLAKAARPSDRARRLHAGRDMKLAARAASVAAVALLAAAHTGCASMDQEMQPVVAVAPAAGSCDAAPQVGSLCGCVYDVGPKTRYLGDFTASRPVEELCTDRLSVSLRNGAPGFPGVLGRYEWFGVDFRGAFVVATPGTFWFRLTSDDGAKLYIDDALVVNNDGRHDVQTAESVVQLGAGTHRIHIPYYNGPGPMALTLEVGRSRDDYRVFRAGVAL